MFPPNKSPGPVSLGTATSESAKEMILDEAVTGFIMIQQQPCTFMETLQNFMNAIKVTNNLSAGLRTRSEASALRWLREKQSFASETYPPDLQFFAVWDVKSAVGKPFHLECHYPVACPMPNSKE
ncbi:predicted protein [Histoplasma capsulatum H143]|uniref:Uncharacterized protein n=1 Tax=Ajellomyces capsulatus (strain H143) TaxID=544712 RepID=C6HRM7_AJECH|nr:predicted protein [Histoplasma capsulatum H143]